MHSKLAKTWFGFLAILFLSLACTRKGSDAPSLPEPSPSPTKAEETAPKPAVEAAPEKKEGPSLIGNWQLTYVETAAPNGQTIANAFTDKDGRLIRFTKDHVTWIRIADKLSCDPRPYKVEKEILTSEANAKCIASQYTIESMTADKLILKYGEATKGITRETFKKIPDTEYNRIAESVGLPDRTQ